MSNYQILVVEDETLVARDIQNKLTRLGHHVPQTVISGQAALESVAESRPDLVLMDIRLKGSLDGIQTAAKLRALFNLPVIYLTAFSDAETVKRARGTQPLGYIHKPLTVKSLGTAIQIGMDRHAENSALAEEYQQYQASQRNLKALLQELTVEDDVKKHKLAHELENKVAQVLLAAKAKLAIAPLYASGAAFRQEIEDVDQMLALSTKQLHDYTEKIRPSLLEMLGLVPALHAILTHFAQDTGVKVNLETEPADISLPKDVAHNCYHAIDGALEYFAQVPGITKLQIKLTQSQDQLAAHIWHDGGEKEAGMASGQPEQAGSPGLSGLRARLEISDGQLEINTSPGTGTQIRAFFPLDKA